MKRIIAAFIMVSLVISLVSCGGKDGPTSSIASEVNVNIDKNVSASIRFAITVDPSEKRTAQAFINGFNKLYPNIKINIEPIAGDFRTQLLSQVASNTMPDIAWVPDNWVSIFAEKNALLNLDPYIKASNVDLNDFYPSMLKMGQKNHNGSQYMMPRDYNHVVVYYNKDLFDESKVAYPKDGWTWDEFVETAKKLTKLKDGKIDQYGVNAMLFWQPVYLPIIAGFGGEVLDSKGTPLMNSDKTKQAITVMNDLVKSGSTFNPFNPPPVDAFLSEKAAMFFAPRPFMGNATDAAINFDVVTFPKLPIPFTGTGTSGYGIYSKTKYPNEAWAFLNYMVSKDGQIEFSKTGSAVPVLKSLANDTTWQSFPSTNYNHKAFVKFPENDMIVTYLDGVAIEAQGDVEGRILNMFSDVFSQKKTVDQATSECVAAINQVYETQ